MIRKQLYLEEAQDQALKRRAKELGISEAEVVRRALDEALRPGAATRVRQRKQGILQAYFDEVDELASTHHLPEGYHFDRQALYEEDPRFKRWEHAKKRDEQQ